MRRPGHSRSAPCPGTAGGQLSSPPGSDIERSYALHANAYIVKPVDLDAFSRVISAIDACFLRLAEPSPERELNDHPEHSDHPLLDSAKRE